MTPDALIVTIAAPVDGAGSCRHQPYAPPRPAASDAEPQTSHRLRVGVASANQHELPACAVEFC